MQTMDTVQVPVQPNVTACIPLKRKRKQQLIPRETFIDEIQHSPPSNRLVMEFPNLDFGMFSMDKDDMKRALIVQFHLHTKHAANDKGIDNIDYQTHRLAAVSWFELVLGEDHNSVLIPAVNIMDRYVTTCAHLGDDTRQLLNNIRNIRAACLSLSIKMYAVNMTIDAKDLNRHNRGVNKALVVDPSGNAGKPRLTYILSDASGIQEAERQIIVKLKGAVFPTNAQNMISLLCAYLILDYGKPSTLLTTEYILKDQAAFVASKLLSKTTLDVAFLRLKRWLCIAVCCMLGVIVECVTEPKEGLRVEDSLIALLEELMPGKFTQTELGDLKMLLSQGCVVCTGSFVSRAVRDSLRRISSMSCSDCGKGNAKDTDHNDATTDSEGSPNKVTLCLV